VDIGCSVHGIQSIVDVRKRTDLAKFALKPELISNIISKNREKRRFVSYQELPDVLINAVLASEDRRFFSHSGIDPIRILKALIVDVREGEAVQGASTLTQQFVKTIFSPLNAPGGASSRTRTCPSCWKSAFPKTRFSSFTATRCIWARQALSALWDSVRQPMFLRKAGQGSDVGRSCHACRSLRERRRSTHQDRFRGQDHPIQVPLLHLD
jgi:hypothetical protein